MLSWGEEFCDDGSYGKLYDPREYGTYIGGGLLVPISLLEEIVDPKYLKEITIKDKAKLDTLTGQLSTVGQLQPGYLIYDRNFIRLKDGNHRYIAAKRLGWTSLRVTLHRVEVISTFGLPLSQILPKLMEVAYEI